MKKWFTLIELIVALTILAILSTMSFISLQEYSMEMNGTTKNSHNRDSKQENVEDYLNKCRDLWMKNCWQKVLRKYCG